MFPRHKAQLGVRCIPVLKRGFVWHPSLATGGKGTPHAFIVLSWTPHFSGYKTWKPGSTRQPFGPWAKM